MPKSFKQKAARLLGIAAGLYMLIGLVLYLLQDRLLFHPEKLPATHVYAFDQPFREINLEVSADKNLAIVQFTAPAAVCKGVVLYFHGNRRNVERYATFAKNFTGNNYEVWMPDYPGFGKSTGKLTEETMYKDADLLYQMARARFGKDSIIIYGKSLGTGVAAELAAKRDCRRLILETPYYSIPELFRHYAFMYPAEWMSHYKLPTCQYLANVDAPLTIFHGRQDEVIPYDHAERLLKIATHGAELITIEKGSHNNLNDFPLFHKKLDSLLNTD